MRKDINLIKSKRKTLAVEVKSDGSVWVRAPKFMSEREIYDFVRINEDKIEKWIAKANKINEKKVNPISEEEKQNLKVEAKDVFEKRCAYYAPLIGVTYNKITVRFQKTRWGSCSQKGNLNFNAALMFAPAEVTDSVVVHELCHIKHLNHSNEFYKEVFSVMPDYAKNHAWLKENGYLILKRCGV